MSREIKFRAWFKGNEKTRAAFIAGFNMINFHSYFNKGLEPSVQQYRMEIIRNNFITIHWTQWRFFASNIIYK